VSWRFNRTFRLSPPAVYSVFLIVMVRWLVEYGAAAPPPAREHPMRPVVLQDLRPHFLAPFPGVCPQIGCRWETFSDMAAFRVSDGSYAPMVRACALSYASMVDSGSPAIVKSPRLPGQLMRQSCSTETLIREGKAQRRET